MLNLPWVSAVASPPDLAGPVHKCVLGYIRMISRVLRDALKPPLTPLAHVCKQTQSLFTENKVFSNQWEFSLVYFWYGVWLALAAPIHPKGFRFGFCVVQVERFHSWLTFNFIRVWNVHLSCCMYDLMHLLAISRSCPCSSCHVVHLISSLSPFVNAILCLWKKTLWLLGLGSLYFLGEGLEEKH